VVVLSQVTQFLSLEPVATVTGLPQIRPPSVDRLASTSTDEVPRPSEVISHTLALAS
jgi:hypothetical protein